MQFTLTPSRLVLAFSAIFFASNCLADVIYSDLNSPLNFAGFSVQGSVASSETGSPAENYNGQQIFQASGNSTVTSVTVGTYYYPVQPGIITSPTDVFSPDFDVWLYSNYVLSYVIHGIVYYQNEPGSALEEVGTDLVAPDNLGLVTANSSLGTTMLTAGSLYWVVLTPANPDTLVVWGSTNTSESLEVDGRQITPEPSTFAFVSLAGGVALLLAWKRRTAAASDLECAT